MKVIEGHGVALITPFTKDGEIDFKAIPKIIEHIIEGNADYIVIMGTTAETPTLNNNEKLKIINKIVKTNNARLPLVIGIGGNDTNNVVKNIINTNLKPFSAILSVTPYYNKPNQEGLYEHFKIISSNSKLPIILYNVPSRTGLNLEPETVIRLANNFHNIIGIKEASGNLSQVHTILKTCPKTFSVLSGDDEMSLPLLLAGGKGVISVIGNAIPKIFSKLVKAAIKGDSKNAYLIQYEILELIRAIYDEGNPTGIKVLMNELSLCENSLRLPLHQASSELTLKLKKLFNELRA